MKVTDDKKLYSAFKAGDKRLDGRFFVGVKTTGIYCRPTCKARMPKEENCVFFESAAEAEQAGFRPCLVCRPELAPSVAAVGTKVELAGQTARFLEENCGSGRSIEELAKKLGYSDRHLRRIFVEEYNVTPTQYMQTCRLLLAKGLLTDTSLSVTDVAMTSGFGSLRRFNDAFLKHYNLSPTGMRKSIKKGKEEDSGVTAAVGYRSPYRWEEILGFLEERAIPGVEAVIDGSYCRTLRMTDKNNKEVFGWIKVKEVPEKSVLSVTLSEKLLPVMPQVLARVRNLFDLYCDPQVVGETLASMNETKKGLFPMGLRVPGCVDIFELSVRAVLGQQITVKAAGTLAGRMAETLGKPVRTDVEKLKFIFPSAESVAKLGEKTEACLGSLGIINSRARAILSLAGLFSQDRTKFEFCEDPVLEMKQLMEIPGIGPWTAKYIAMRGMGWTDAFLETDLGVKKALDGQSSKEMLKLSEVWKPWRSYVTMALWNSL